ncbi:polynucleotide phosphorylase/polyadenylase [Fimbriimonas ginsengisoli Gsoil 348]|uniref:Polynucleotide phosphorylase/polyadenylase n=1 Tax=Fimbriimonas ginsengisoli Gsoil 348 TaxID=661478 RepID=A0A068NUU1_FIMGI|nr:polynucleotide phosphorylase/polyadenylase [Fimbriimonas ginsengisoli Gsoil 348]
MNAANASGAKNFEPGGSSRFEVMHMGSQGDLAYWTGIQWAKARMKGKSDSVPFNLRVTEVFRRENGDWKLIHRHADRLSEEPADK